MAPRIGVGIAGSGFVARFHVQSWRGVRDADITAIYSRNREAAGELASLCRELRVGEPSQAAQHRKSARPARVSAHGRDRRYQAVATAVCGAAPGSAVNLPRSSLPNRAQLTSRWLPVVSMDASRQLVMYQPASTE